jgi:hypothetical protein
VALHAALLDDGLDVLAPGEVLCADRKDESGQSRANENLMLLGDLQENLWTTLLSEAREEIASIPSIGVLTALSNAQVSPEDRAAAA